MAPRGPNFTTEEDTMICRIHLAISQDSATGTDQPEKVLWSRIKDKLEEALPCKPKRTWTSIQSRFQGISRQVSLYSAKVLEVDGEYHSGWNEVLRVEEIRKRFKESNGNKKFKHEECYEILKDSIKYSGRSTFVFDSGQEMEDSQSGEENADIEETIPGESSDDLDIGDIENSFLRTQSNGRHMRFSNTDIEISDKVTKGQFLLSYLLLVLMWMDNHGVGLVYN
ncbi:uncharacterized protein LOC113330083 [Papaver somniferum]|uniref:uncharacterized protein LOC113330083 n=1 Tax=Papaver somniferum TaxID=3469 RepID=UPI000E6F561F|nr:uncharacterized protein LOC113330083 [Papaver somniferum]